jgi:3-hydroxyacyl-[acyl-carrier-protein] dehydratase
MRWMWIDRVLSLSPAKQLVAIKHVSLAEEHLHDHFAASDGLGPALPMMPASLIIEGCAQAAGILVGHAGAFKEKVILAKVNRATLALDAMPGHTLRYTANIDRMDASGASTHVLIERIDHAASGGTPRTEDMGKVELMFSHIDQNMKGLAFPEHNFVFGEQFKTLLRTSGVA